MIPGLTDSAAAPVGGLEIDTTTPLNIIDAWRVSLQSDETLNDSDKTFTVPADTEWQILWIWAEFTTTATVGNRQLVIEIQDTANDVIGQPARAGVTQAASLTYYYQFGPGLADLVAFRDTDWLSAPIPPTTILKAGDIVRVYDNNAVDAAADDLILQMQIAARSV
jgi:hypothetical protein